LGDHAGAKKVSEESVELGRRLGDREKTAIALAGLGDIYRAEGNLEEARKYASEAVSIFDQIGDKQSSARFQLELAELSIDEHRGADAAAIASRVAQEFERERAIRDQSLANAILAQALLSQGNVPAAKRAVEGALAFSDKYHDRQVELLVALTAARVRAASGSAPDRLEATNRLQQVLADSAKTGFLRYTFEARLALGELELQSGNRLNGRQRLESLMKDASDKNFELVAREAATDLKQVSQVQ
jgi:tetratricopeptide (TPR) repeat protein